MSGDKVKPNPLKAELRVDVDARLAAMTDVDRERQSKVILSKILAHPKYISAKRISLFLSLPTEVPTEPILNDILARGDAAFVPQYSRGQMRMLRVLPGGLDLVIAPGAAFTREGWRCGHGGGYYDRYLTALRARHDADAAFRNPYIIAVGFNQQIYPSVPVDIQDVRVHEVSVKLVVTVPKKQCNRYLTALRARHDVDPAFRNPYIIAVGFTQQIDPSVPVDIQHVRVHEVLTAE